MIELVERLPPPRRRVSVEWSKETGILHVRIKTTPYDIKALMFLLWLVASFVVLPVVELYTSLLSRIVLWILVPWTSVSTHLIGRAYFYGFFLCSLPIGLVFIVLARCFKTTVDISSSSLAISGLRTRRWSLKDVTSIRFERIRKRQATPTQGQVVIEERALMEEERVWLNNLLQKLLTP